MLNIAHRKKVFVVIESQNRANSTFNVRPQVNAVEIWYGAAVLTATRRVFADQTVVVMNDNPAGPHPDMILFRMPVSFIVTANVRAIRLPGRSLESTTFETWPSYIQGYGGGRPILQWGQFRVLTQAECNNRRMMEICNVARAGETTTESGDSGKIRNF